MTKKAMHKKLSKGGLLVASALFISSANAANPTINQKAHEQATHNNALIRMFFKNNLPTENISIDSRDNILQISGFVDNNKQMLQLSKVLSNYLENDRVINNVKVLSIHDLKSDERILKNKVVKSLEKENFNSKDISIQVRNGHVILAGFINKHVSARSIGKTVENVPGVTKVDNYVLYKA